MAQHQPTHVREHVTFGARAWAWTKELTVIVVSALVLSFVIKTFFVQSFWIPSSSMEHTLEIGDRILVTKWRPGVFDLRRGDVVVFRDPGTWLVGTPEPAGGSLPEPVAETLRVIGVLPADAGEHLVKRVIGLPGDNVVCCDSEGYLTVNGERLVEPYLAEGVEPSTTEFDIVVPDGYLWVMGDNRPHSADSRSHMGEPGGGAVSMDLVVGTAFVTVWPPSNVGGEGPPDWVATAAAAD